jgi:nucleoside-diphosphate-sugar epimerase
VTGRRRVLLFGASGFIGSQVGAALEEDPRVSTVIRASRRPSEPDATWISHDLLMAGTDQLAMLIRGIEPDAVINCVGRLSGDSAELVESNVLITAHMIEAVTRAAPGARLVVLGSAAEYGPTPHGCRVDEDYPARPVAPYGVTRLASTQLVLLAHARQQLDGVALRVFNPVGPGVPPENLLGRAAVGIRSALDAGTDTVTLGPLGAYRDFIDVRDVATAIAGAALAEQVPDRVLNVGSGRPVQCREAVALMAATAGFTGRFAEANPAPSRSGSVDWSAADISRIERSLGWTPRYDLRDSMAATWRSSGPMAVAAQAGN